MERQKAGGPNRDRGSGKENEPAFHFVVLRRVLSLGFDAELRDRIDEDQERESEEIWEEARERYQSQEVSNLKEREERTPHR